MRKLGYQPSLDGVRCLAVGLVLAHHGAIFLFPSALSGVLPGGFLGVDLFFVLSGFLITTLLLEEGTAGRVRVGAFYARRALRLLPALVVVLVVNSAIVLAQGVSPRRVLGSDLVVLFYVGNWVKTFSTDVVDGLGHTWSLAVEEQFYLVWPWLVLLALHRRLSHRALAWWFAGGVLASAALRAVLWSQAGGDYERVYFRTDARADALLVGALLGVAWHSGYLARVRMPGWVPHAALAVLASAVVTVHNDSGLLLYGGFTVVAVVCAVLIASVLQGAGTRSETLARAGAWPVAVHFGRISYGLYLWHIPMYNLAHELTDHVTVLYVVRPVIGLAFTLAGAELSMRYVESPFLRWKRRLSRRGVTTAPATV